MTVIDGMSLLAEAAVVVGGDQPRCPSTTFPGVPISSFSSPPSRTPARYSIRHHPASRSESTQDVVPTSASQSQPPFTPHPPQATHVLPDHALTQISDPLHIPLPFLFQDGQTVYSLGPIYSVFVLFSSISCKSIIKFAQKKSINVAE